MRKGVKIWTYHEQEKLKQLRLTNKTVKEIAYTLGRTARSVSKKLERDLRAQERPIDPKLVVRNMWADGRPVEEISSLLNLTPERVLDIVERLGMVPKRPPQRVNWNSSLTDQLRALTKEGLSMGRIAKILGISRNAVIGRSHRLKLSQHRPSAKERNQPPVAKKLKVSGGAVFVVEKVANSKHNYNGVKSKGFVGLSLQELDRGECRYPYGGSNGIPVSFCGQRIKPGSSYCPECHARCWTPVRRTGA